MFTKNSAIQMRQYLLKEAEALKQQREAVLSQVALLEREYQIEKKEDIKNDRPKTVTSSIEIAG